MNSIFRFCPRCGSDGIGFEKGLYWLCPSCGFQYFHNTAAAAGVILRDKGRILFIKRAAEPARGKLAVPGGFIGPGETAEEAAVRETREELGAEIRNLRFIASRPNLYLYRDIPYNTCDLFFTADLITSFGDFTIEKSEIEEVSFLKPEEINYDDIAFTSLKEILRITAGDH